MSVLIEGLHMPTEDEIIIRIQPNGAILDQCGHRLLQKAIPIPPHGRLVDADALISRCKDEKGSYYGHESAIIGEAVESAPTVIETEEVYGQYTNTAGNFHWCGTHSGEHTIRAEGINHD